MGDSGPSEFGARLRRLREAAGLTQEELAERAGLSVEAVSALERGTRRRPYTHTARALATALGLADTERDALLGARRGVGVPDPTPPAPQRGRSTPAPPVPPTPLVGREAEIATVTGLLVDGAARLVTLIGPGGVGKTRLALAVADEVTAAFADGVAFVSLAPLADPALVVPAIAQALGVREVAGQTLSDILRASLSDKQTLFVLDNFEHVTGAAPALAGLLAACPGLALLVTSRAPLRVRGEREYPVAPLDLPDLSRVPTVGEAAESPAVQLFVQRARDILPTFELTQANVTTVAAICRRLDGLPLALELAAAWVRLLSPTALLARLDRALPLLAGGAQDLPARQRTMENAIRWSYDLLGPEEQVLFRRLTVFAGRWTLGAAESVGTDRAVEPDGVLELLGRLVEQALVVAEPNPGADEVRYRMLEPVRQYALQLLEESGEAEAVRRRHAGLYLELAEAARPELRGPRQLEWLERLDRENDNLRAAMVWALSAGELETAARLGWALWLFWWLRGRLAEGRQWMEQVLAAAEQLANVPTVRALMVVQTLAYGQGDIEAVERYSQQLLQISGELGDAHAEGYARYGLGLVAMSRQNPTTASAYLEAALPLLEQVRDHGMASSAQAFLGRLLLLLGDYEAAIRRFEGGLALARRQGDSLGISIALFNLAQVAQTRGDNETAARRLREGVALSVEMRHHTNLAYFVERLAEVDLARGRPNRSARLLGAADGLLESIGATVYNYYAPDRSRRERVVAEVRQRLGEATFDALWAEGQSMKLEATVAEALEEGERACGEFDGS